MGHEVEQQHEHGSCGCGDAACDVHCAGVGFVMRKLGGAAHPEQTWTLDADGTVRVHTVTTFKTSDLAFKLGVEFDEKRLDDEVCKVRPTDTLHAHAHLSLLDVDKSALELQQEYDSYRMCTTLSRITYVLLYVFIRTCARAERVQAGGRQAGADHVAEGRQGEHDHARGARQPARRRTQSACLPAAYAYCTLQSTLSASLTLLVLVPMHAIQY